MLPDYRSDVLKLLTPILKLRDHSILNPTPSPVAYGIFPQLGFVPLESERLILPLPGIRRHCGDAVRIVHHIEVRARAGADR